MDQTITLTQSLADRKATATQRCAHLAAQLNQSILFGMTTALELQEIPVPTQCGIDATALHSTASAVAKRIDLSDGSLRSHLWRPIAADPRAAIPITATVHALHPFHVWAQLARHVDLEDLIILGDAVLAARSHDARDTRRSLITLINATRGFAGRTACLRALPHLREHVASPMETIARLAATRHGMPCPLTNYTVPGETFPSGAAMTLDMAWVRFRVAVEYDGDHHRTDKAQWRRDQEKRERLRSHGWIVIVITADSLRDAAHRAEFAFLVARYLLERGATFEFRPVAMSLESRVPHSRVLTLDDCGAA
ncbi:hypothetical protein DSM100688_2179 [Bifidobacterium ramosum]|uniref:DUF559 domain-containing protein n=1 Tax=Bifidobacterium ramosum TaxID=1798158 RepID=A0A6L4WX25_9BIFI|nr:hypothetical protein [Bifidobacterium ramosum]KAB8286742.1 hypothetical protein DSM100688_2179 [Bifidobacterium ramosum]NEG71728.1 hypothetical protein [Bifidobacterium ramosum]